MCVFALQHPEYDLLPLEDAYCSHHIAPDTLRCLLDICLQDLPSGALMNCLSLLPYCFGPPQPQVCMQSEFQDWHCEVRTSMKTRTLICLDWHFSVGLHAHQALRPATLARAVLQLHVLSAPALTTGHLAGKGTVLRC